VKVEKPLFDYQVGVEVRHREAAPDTIPDIVRVAGQIELEYAWLVQGEFENVGRGHMQACPRVDSACLSIGRTKLCPGERFRLPLRSRCATGRKAEKQRDDTCGHVRHGNGVGWKRGLQSMAGRGLRQTAFRNPCVRLVDVFFAALL
jgi:hypothetical protein